MTRGEIVKDDEGNHFIVLKVMTDTAQVESVATRECFIIPLSELHPSDRVAF